MASSNSNTEYVFNRDFNASIRLNLNHWLYKGLAGYLLHPKIECPKDAVVADIGTGTAIWLQELAETLPAPAKLVGFDNSPEQFPCEAWRMPNVSLVEHDCFQPFPAEHIGKYDIVAIKFFRCIVRNNDPQPLLKNVMTLLKPGGYLQWYDVMGAECHVEKPDQSLATPMSERLAKMSHLPAPDLSAEWINQLPETFTKNNLEVVVEHRIPFRNAYRLPWGQSMLAGIEETSARRGEEGVKQGKMMIDGLCNEMAQGALVEHPILCVVGRKTE